MPQFDPTYFASQIFWLLVCFVFLTAFVGLVAVPRIRKGVNIRRKFLEEMEDREHSYRERIDEIENRITSIKTEQLQKSKSFMEGLHQKLTQEREDQLRHLTQKFIEERRSVAEELSSEIHRIRDKMPTLSAEIVEKLEEQLIGSGKKGTKIHAIH